MCLAFSSMSLAQTTGAPNSQPNAITKCEGLTGAALDQCKREAAPGRSEDAASRAKGTVPGGSADATSRTGTPPKSDIEKGKK